MQYAQGRRFQQDYRYLSLGFTKGLKMLENVVLELGEGFLASNLFLNLQHDFAGTTPDISEDSWKQNSNKQAKK